MNSKSKKFPHSLLRARHFPKYSFNEFGQSTQRVRWQYRQQLLRNGVGMVWNYPRLILSSRVGDAQGNNKEMEALAILDNSN